MNNSLFYVFNVLDRNTARHRVPNIFPVKRLSARFEMVSFVAVFASIVVMGLETFDTLPEEVPRVLKGVDTVLALLFVLEYAYRIKTAKNKRAYILSFYGVIDLIALFPIVAPMLKSARVVRLVRLLRIICLLYTSPSPRD